MRVAWFSVRAAARRLSGVDLFNDGQVAAAVGQIGHAHGIAVHHGLVIRRHVEIAGYVFREDAAEKSGSERRDFRRQRSGVRKDSR